MRTSTLVALVSVAALGVGACGSADSPETGHGPTFTILAGGEGPIPPVGTVESTSPGVSGSAPPSATVTAVSAVTTTTPTTTTTVVPTTTTTTIVTTDIGTCARLADGWQPVDPAAQPARYELLLIECMATARTAEEQDLLARLQLQLLTEMPSAPSAPLVGADLAANPAACDHLGAVRDLDGPGGPVTLSVVTACGGFAELAGRSAQAMRLYRQVMTNGPGTEWATTAETGLARLLIAEAVADGAREFDRPAWSGSTGTANAQLLFSNDTAYEQTLAVLGPVGRVVTIPASDTSSSYPTRPTGCRTDVPSVTLDLPPGEYQVMVGDEYATDVGTWYLDGGAQYGWCAFYVTSY